MTEDPNIDSLAVPPVVKAAVVPTATTSVAVLTYIVVVLALPFWKKILLAVAASLPKYRFSDDHIFTPSAQLSIFRWLVLPEILNCWVLLST
jgi:hypothetical protein